MTIDEERKEDGWRRANIGRLLNNAAECFEKRVLQLLAERDHCHVSPAHLHLTRNLDLAGTRLTELARRASMTKQAMSEIVAQCEALGLIHRIADPTDSRAKIVLFSQPGLEWLDAFRQALEQAEREMEEQLEPDAMPLIKKALIKYADL